MISPDSIVVIDRILCMAKRVSVLPFCITSKTQLQDWYPPTPSRIDGTYYSQYIVRIRAVVNWRDFVEG
jgi:hypothetical protein